MFWFQPGQGLVSAVSRRYTQIYTAKTERSFKITSHHYQRRRNGIHFHRGVPSGSENGGRAVHDCLLQGFFPPHCCFQ